MFHTSGKEMKNILLNAKSIGIGIMKYCYAGGGRHILGIRGWALGFRFEGFCAKTKNLSSFGL